MAHREANESEKGDPDASANEENKRIMNPLRTNKVFIILYRTMARDSTWWSTFTEEHLFQMIEHCGAPYPNVMVSLKRTFQQMAQGEFCKKDTFQKWIESLGVNAQHAQRHVVAASISGKEHISLNEFLVYAVCANPDCPHDLRGVSGEARLRLIFHLYDVAGDQILDASDLRHMAR